MESTNHNIYLCSSIQDIGASSEELKFKNTNIYLEEDLIISGSIKFEDSCSINCNGKITWIKERESEFLEGETLYDIGIEFQELKPEEKEAIKERLDIVIQDREAKREIKD